MKTEEMKKESNRHIVVIDRGWIFAGNLAFDPETSVYTLTDCVNVESYKNGGFGGLSKSAKAVQAKLTPCEPITFHEGAKIFACPITDDWDK